MKTLEINKIIPNKKFNTLIYYSKLNYSLLFQRPQQIMRHFSNTYNKIFIGSQDYIKYEEKNSLLIIPYKLKDNIIEYFKDTEIYIYYTDPRLYLEISNIKSRKIFDLIDAPVDEFKCWKSDLHLCVKNSDFVTYSHPNLIKYLQDIQYKEYHYLSNACDYDSFKNTN